jgi:hypothetical protein
MKYADRTMRIFAGVGLHSFGAAEWFTSATLG